MVRVLVAFAVALTAIAANAEPPDGPTREFTGRDLFGLQVATDPQIHPDGAVVAYTRVSYDVMTDRPRPSIWLVDVATGAQTPLITGPGSNTTPRWSPDGKRLAYVSTADEGRPQLYVQWLDAGRSSRLVSAVTALSASEIR